jgi:CopG family transcriptional regulator, nickel-responsive regulator
MTELTRTSISVEADLLQRFQKLSKRQGMANCSEAVRHLMREALVRDEWETDADIVGTITIVYDHHKRDLSDRLNSIQHDHHELILSSMHVHLDHDNCLEVIAVRGPGAKVQKIADQLIGTRGVKHGKLSATTTGRRLK